MLISITIIIRIPTSIRVATNGILVVAVVDLVRGIDPGHDLVRGIDRDHGLVRGIDRDHGLVRENGQALDQVLDQARDENQAQWIESRHQGNQVVPERVTKVPLAATRVAKDLPGTVNVVGRVVPASHVRDHQEVQ